MIWISLSDAEVRILAHATTRYANSRHDHLRIIADKDFKLRDGSILSKEKYDKASEYTEEVSTLAHRIRKLLK